MQSSNYLLQGHRKVPAPPSIHAENINNIKLGGNNQKLILFNLGNRFTMVVSYHHGLCLHPQEGASPVVSEDPTHNLNYFGFLHILPMYT